MYGWNDKPNKVESHLTEDDRKVYEIGRYLVSIHADGSVSYRDKYQHASAKDSTMPNMDVRDGEIRIPVTDLVGEILKRLEPRDLAVALWDNQEVRDEFLDCLVTFYNERRIGDHDRRKFLHGVKEAVHKASVDGLSNAMSKLEYDVSKRSFFYHEVNAINARLHEVQQELRGRFDDESIELPRLRHEDNDPDFKIGGKHWNDARTWWRDEVAKRFPGPEAPTAVTLDDEVV